LHKSFVFNFVLYIKSVTVVAYNTSAYKACSPSILCNIM